MTEIINDKIAESTENIRFAVNTTIIIEAEESKDFKNSDSRRKCNLPVSFCRHRISGNVAATVEILVARAKPPIPISGFKKKLKRIFNATEKHEMQETVETFFSA